MYIRCSDISLHLSIDGKPYFSGNMDNNFYKKDITMDDAVYILLSTYYHWRNVAYIIHRIKKTHLDFNIDEEDYKNPSKHFLELIKNETKKAKFEWIEKYSEDKILSLKK